MSKTGRKRGRPKLDRPPGARRRVIVATDEEFEALKRYLEFVLRATPAKP